MFFKTFAGVPEVTLNKISPVHPKTCVTLEATIRNVFECDSVIWRKHDHSYHDPKFEFRVDINQNGSVVMRINDVRKEDAGTYTIEAHNKYGKGQSSKELKVIGGMYILSFIMGLETTKILNAFNYRVLVNCETK